MLWYILTLFRVVGVRGRVAQCAHPSIFLKYMVLLLILWPPTFVTFCFTTFCIFCDSFFLRHYTYVHLWRHRSDTIFDKKCNYILLLVYKRYCYETLHNYSRGKVLEKKMFYFFIMADFLDDVIILGILKKCWRHHIYVPPWIFFYFIA